MAGQLLAHLRRDLSALQCEALDDASARFHDPVRRLSFIVEEEVERHFLMRITMARFTCPVPGSAPGSQRLLLRHTGRFRRTGIECVPAAPHISGDTALQAALLPLDFTRCQLLQDEAGWRCQLVHYAASEVAGRLPPLRRYIRLHAAQQQALLDAFAALCRLLTAAPGATPAATPRHPPRWSAR